MQITSVRFTNFKALRRYSISLQRMNILVGPNNCGKSTVLSAFRVLEHAIRVSRAKRAVPVTAHTGGRAFGHPLQAVSLPVPIENVHSDYVDEDSRIEFKFSNGNSLYLFFPATGGAFVYWEVVGRRIDTAGGFRRAFPLSIQVVPVLGPVEQDEIVVTDETVRRATGTSRASRHFRNYWHKNPEGFDQFRRMVEETWRGMSVNPPEVVNLLERRLAMFCSEDRVARELYWSGFGFQIWCQLLTHISRHQQSNLLIVDEPEIYLHPDVQRQLLTILRDIKPDVIMATHSSEILAEADPSEILMIDKTRASAKRLRDMEGVQAALDAVGSVQNITLTQLARTRKILFVEGFDDWKRIRRFARVCGFTELAAGADLTPLESGGYSSWERVRALGWGFRNALGSRLRIAAVYDRDFRSDEEVEQALQELKAELDCAHIHARKEMENYLLVPAALERAVEQAVREKGRRSGDEQLPAVNVKTLLQEITSKLKLDCQGQYVGRHCEFRKRSRLDHGTLASEALGRFDEKWRDLDRRMELVPGKHVLSELRGQLQEMAKVTLTDIRIIDAFKREEVPTDLTGLLENLETYRRASLASGA